MTMQDEKEITTVDQLKVKLLEAGFDSAVIENNMDVVASALTTSKSWDGLQMPLFASTQVGNTSLYQPQPLIHPDTGRPAHRVERDPVKIFEIYYDIKQRNLEQQRQKQQEHNQKIEHQIWLYEKNTAAHERRPDYRQWFYDYPVECPILGGVGRGYQCSKRYKSLSDVRDHFHF